MNKKKTYFQRIVFTACFALSVLLLTPSVSEAYIGPGAGFAFVSSFFILFIAFILAIFTLLTWPIRWMLKAILKSRRMSHSRVKRVVIVGLDGQDPELTQQWMDEGLLPNFKRLSEQGAFTKLKTTLPAESPVAWSSFQTGCNPGKHHIYDFLVPNRKAMVPELSSANVRTSPRILKLGKYNIPLGRPSISLGRKSQPFWSILSQYGIFSSILRVPITFPPEKFDGVLLSAMCLPDLKGSQGTYFYYTSNIDEKHDLISGTQLLLIQQNGKVCGNISGPENTMLEDAPEMEIPFEIKVDANHPNLAEIRLNGKIHCLKLNETTPYIRLAFHAGLGQKVYGLVRFRLLETSPHIRLYMTPIQIDPEKPALPISYPYTYAVYLAKQQGAFSTLGVAEDTSALNEGIIDEEAFLEQCQTIHAEREAMFFDALQKTPRGVTACVFDITDRMQHMFFRCMDDCHPANLNRPVEPYREQFKKLYMQMDDLVGRVMKEIDQNSVLIVLSDHGFKPFKRGVNLNRWLMENGYLALKENAASDDMLQAVDWNKTKAYAVGFGGIFINQKGRERDGIVALEQVETLKQEIAEKLCRLVDVKHNTNPVKVVYDRNKAYSGPYTGDAPDLVAGFQVGYRVSWSSITGGIGESVIEDNTRPWSGDHNMNPPDVPGMLFCNQPITKDEPDIMDIAPSVLDLFGIPIPGYMDGKSLFTKIETTNKEIY